MADEARITKQQLDVVHFQADASDARFTKQQLDAVHFQTDVATARITKQQLDVVHFLSSGFTITGATGIPSAEAFGSGGAVSLQVILTGAAGIVSGEAFGADGVVAENLLDGRDVAGIVSGEAFGSGGSVTGPITGSTGIPSAEAFGAALEGLVFQLGIIGSTGIPSAEAFGADGIVGGAITGSTGIPTGEAFGALGSITGPITGISGIVSAEVFGTTGSVTGPITGAAGIVSAEAFGTDGTIATIVGAKGIPSLEQFGADGSLLFPLLGLVGIPSAERFGQSGAVLQLIDDPVASGNSPFVVHINGQQMNALVDSVRVDRQLNFLGASTFRVYDEAGTYFPSLGQDVLLFFWDEDSSEWKKIFAGTVDSFETTKVATTSGLEIFHDIAATDWAKALSRRIIRTKYAENSFGTLTSILEDISEKYLVPEGISYVSQGDPGIVIGDIEFDAVPLNEALDKLAELTGWNWQIDFDKNFRFYSRPAESTSAPWTIAETPNEDWRDLRVRQNRGLYRNRVYIKSTFAKATTGIMGAPGYTIFGGPGGIITFEYTVPTDTTIDGLPVFYSGQYLSDNRYENHIKRILSITLNGTPLSWYYLDEGGAPSGWDYVVVWGNSDDETSPGKLDMVWNHLGKPGAFPTGGDVLRVTFEATEQIGGTVQPSGNISSESQGVPPMVIDNQTEIDARAAVEGGTGIYASSEIVDEVDDPQLLEEYANALLDRFSEFGVEVTIETEKWGLEPGQDMSLNLPSWNVTGVTGTVERISLEERQRTVLTHRVTVSNQIQQRDALATMQRLIRRIRKNPVKQLKSIAFNLAWDSPPLDHPGIVVRNDVARQELPWNMTLKDIKVNFATAPTGDTITLDVKSNGVSVLLSGSIADIGSGQYTFESFASAPLTLPKGAIIRIDVLQVGSTTPGKNGTVTVTGYV